MYVRIVASHACVYIRNKTRPVHENCIVTQARKLFAFLRRRRRCAARTLARYWSWNSFSKTETFAKADISRHVTHRMTVTQFRLLSMPSSFHRHFVGKTLRNACYSAVAEIRSFGRLMLTSIFSETNWMVELYLNNMVNLRPLTRYINAKLYRQNGERIVDNRMWRHSTLCICSRAASQRRPAAVEWTRDSKRRRFPPFSSQLRQVVHIHLLHQHSFIHRVTVKQFRSGFRRHFAGKTLRNVCYSVVTRMRFKYRSCGHFSWAKWLNCIRVTWWIFIH